MKLYGGIDLHSNNNVIAIVDESDRVVYQKRLPNDLDTILKRLAPYQSESVRARGARGGVDLQLVLVGGWFGGCWLYGALGEHSRYQTI